MNTISSVNEISWAAIAPLIGLQFILVVVAIVSLIKAEQVNGPKWLWAIVIVCGQMIGSVVYFIFGRRGR